MMFEQLGPWMGMIVYLKNKECKYIRELNLDEAERSEELFATWIDPPGMRDHFVFLRETLARSLSWNLESLAVLKPELLEDLTSILGLACR